MVSPSSIFGLVSFPFLGWLRFCLFDVFHRCFKPVFSIASTRSLGLSLAYFLTDAVLQYDLHCLLLFVVVLLSRDVIGFADILFVLLDSPSTDYLA